MKGNTPVYWAETLERHITAFDRRDPSAETTCASECGRTSWRAIIGSLAVTLSTPCTRSSALQRQNSTMDLQPRASSTFQTVLPPYKLHFWFRFQQTLNPASPKAFQLTNANSLQCWSRRWTLMLSCLRICCRQSPVCAVMAASGPWDAGIDIEGSGVREVLRSPSPWPQLGLS